MSDTLAADVAVARSTWEIRLRMAMRGWRSDTRIMESRDQEPFFQIWFKRWDWHGKIADVCFHGGRAVSLDAEVAAGDLETMFEVTRRIAVRAAQAWVDFPSTIPCQGLDGTPVENAWGTERAVERPHGWPTERFPLDPEKLWQDSERGDPVMASALELAALGATYTDDLSPRPNAGWHLDRTWRHEHGVAFPRWNGVLTDCRAVRQSSDQLWDGFVAATLRSTRENFAWWLAQYGPGLPGGELPPCLGPSTLPRQNAENAIRLAELVANQAVLRHDTEAELELASIWEARRVSDRVLSRIWCPVTPEIVRVMVEGHLDTMRSGDTDPVQPTAP